MAGRRNRTLTAAGALILLLSACAETAQLPFSATVGREPAIPAPDPSLIPTVLIAPALGWPTGVQPVGAPGTAVNAFAVNLDHPRWLHVLPNGDVLVAETNAPPRPEDNKGLKGWIMKQVMKRAGAAVPSANRITLLRDSDGDGVAEKRSVFLDGLHSPFGMALVGSDLYVANTDAVVRFPYSEGTMRITAPGTKIVELPAGPLNHHWTKNIIASPDGAKLYATVGSNSNVAEHGVEREHGRAAVWEIDLKTHTHRIFASGLRNPNGLAWHPTTGSLWTVVNERDELGSDLVPDYLTSVKDGGFYGWPYSYFGAHVDSRVQPQRPELVARAIVPDYSLGPHVAALGLTHSSANALPPIFLDGMFVGQHGSWNRRPRSGYNVVFVAFEGGSPSGRPIEVLSGFVSPEGKAYGRPVGVAIDGRGALLVADDVGNVIWRVSAAAD
jgi:glucose/arabinose dehydrogenase